MICVYPAGCTDFSTNGNGTLAPLSAEATEILNSEYELKPGANAISWSGTVTKVDVRPNWRYL